MGSVQAYATASGKRYRVRYRQPDHSQTDKRGFRTRKEAELFLAGVEVQKARGEYVAPADARVTIGELGPQWLATRTHLKASSAHSLEVAWRLHVAPHWSTMSVSAVRHSDVQAWVTTLSEQRSATVVLRAHGVLASILDVAVADRRILSNSARRVKLPRKVGREHTYLTPEQVSALVLAAGDRGTLVLLLAYCGLRWGEATALRVRDLDMLRRRILVSRNAVEVGREVVVGTPKTYARRSVPFPATLAPMLAQACEGKGREDLVFSRSIGTFVARSKSSVGWFAVAARRAGIEEKLTPHDLRHTAASLAVSAGANVKAVQRMLGHASAAMTLDVYADLFDDDLDDVAGRLDQRLARTVVGKMWARAENTEPQPTLE